ncbi:MAG: Molybdopterin guanine dinucleotide synthesis protein B [Firmicutes bacterium ADurb.Bin182]|nr:MAG: Molybdopterin guanine dinucleotide synthesis protein B [Firmicutes bacterium ADurb.Bin182]
MKVISVIGITGSGKTTVCEVIIRGLRARGFSVGSVKEIHFEQFKIDSDPKANTNRHREAGAELVTARGFYETDVLFRTKLPIDRILSFYDHDFVILEGVTDCNAPLIIAAHSPKEVDERLTSRAVAVSGVIANSGVRQVFDLPVFNALNEPDKLVEFVKERAFEPLPSFDPDCCSACGCSCEELAARIIRNEAERSDCRLSAQDVELSIGGKKISMVPFVQKILKNSVLSVANELDGFKGGGEVTVKFRL